MALWSLSHRNFHLMPWVIYDFKTDESINMIQGARHITLDELPTRPGIYIAHPHPDDDVQPHLANIWVKGNTGIFIDEGYMMGNRNRWFRSLLTQGRSKRVPMIILSQRPAWMDRFVFSESEFFSIFHLQHEDDRKNVQKFVPANLDKRLPEFQYRNYNLYDDTVYTMPPVPKIETILGTFERRLRGQRKVV